MSHNGSGSSGIPVWWTMVISGSGIVALFSSHALHLSDATFPIIGMMIMAAPTSAAIRKIKNGGNGE